MITTARLLETAFSGVIFVFCYIVFGKLLLKPFIALLIDREAKTSGSEILAAKRKEETREVRTRLDEALKRARLQGISKRDARIAKARDEAQRHLSDTGAASAARLNRARVEIERLKQQAFADVERESARFAELVAKKVTEGGSKPSIH